MLAHTSGRVQRFRAYAPKIRNTIVINIAAKAPDFIFASVVVALTRIYTVKCLTYFKILWYSGFDQNRSVRLIGIWNPSQRGLTI